MKIAIIGSRTYENTRKVKNLLTELRMKFGDDLVVISGGAKQGADKYVKKYALEFGLNYKEFNPAHTPQNLYSAMSEGYYARSQFHHRNMLIARDCDYMIALVPKGAKTNGTESAVKQAVKLNKKVVIIN